MPLAPQKSGVVATAEPVGVGAADCDVPTAEGDVPAAESEVPTDDTEVPADDSDVPAADSDVPAADMEAAPEGGVTMIVEGPVPAEDGPAAGIGAPGAPP